MKTNVPLYRVVFSYSIDESLVRGQEFQRGECFTIPGEGIMCTVVAVREEEVDIEVERPDGTRDSITLRG